MAFVQFKLDQSIGQSRDIFNKYIYEPGNGDSSTDVAQAGYWSESRFIDDLSWDGSVIEMKLSNGYFVGIVSGGDMPVIYNIDSEFDPETGMELRTILLAISTAPSQIPLAEDTPLTAEWDTKIVENTDYVTLSNDASGRQGLITFIEYSNVSNNVAFDFQKSGGFFSTTTIFGRRLINGTQSGTTVEKDMQIAEEKDNFVDSYSLSFEAGDTLQYEFAYLDDESGLVQNTTVPTGYDPVPCTAIRISRWFKRDA